MRIKKQQKIESLKTSFKNLSNADLLHEVISRSGGDDYDGYFTKDGQMEYDILHEMLIERLGDWYTQTP